MRPLHETTVPRPLLLVLAAFAAVLGACSGVEVHTSGEERVDFRGAESFAWRPSSLRMPPPEPAAAAEGEAVEGVPADEVHVRGDAQRLVEQEMLARGFEKKGIAEAAFYIDLAVNVELRQITLDPYFTNYSFERFEQGRIILTLIDKRSGQRFWSGLAKRRLRVTAHGVGLERTQWVPTEHERDWQLEEMIDAIFAEFPDR